MTKFRLCLISAFLLIATVPWFFTRFRPEHIFGFPLWAFYSFCVTVLYAIVIAFFLHRYWYKFDNENDDWV